MRQAGTAAREFAREFEWRAQDTGMAEEDAKVPLVSALNQGHPRPSGHLCHHEGR